MRIFVKIGPLKSWEKESLGSVVFKYKSVNILYSYTYIMFLDKYISFDKKVFIALIFSGLWIYFRTAQCYEMIPRHEILYNKQKNRHSAQSNSRNSSLRSPV